jgi:hypothetical protein
LLSGILPHSEALIMILRENGALAGNRTFALANALVAAEAIDIARLPEIDAWRRLPDALAPGATLPARPVLPAPVAVPAGREAVNLRFLLGTAIAKPGLDLLADSEVGKWNPARTSAGPRAGDRRYLRGGASPRAAAAASGGRGGARRAARSLRADLREQRDQEVPGVGGRAVRGHQRAPSAGRARRRRTSAFTVIAVRPAGRRGISVSALWARSRRRRRRCSSRCAIAG